MPDVADAMARRRLRDVIRGGGGTVVTSCPTCAFMLGRNAPDGVEVRLLTDVLAEALAEALSDVVSDALPEALPGSPGDAP
jgi:Fe-S oxidoreductase